eukprot:scaffold15976_cov90-Isochrysis_galbana.AAC.2
MRKSAVRHRQQLSIALHSHSRIRVSVSTPSRSPGALRPARPAVGAAPPSAFTVKSSAGVNKSSTPMARASRTYLWKG